jgi:hypothetical protein
MNGIIASSRVEFVKELTISPVSTSEGFTSKTYTINLFCNAN